MSDQEIFRIEGDSSDAIQALEQLGNSLRELPEIITKINTAITKMGTNVERSLKKMEKTTERVGAKFDHLEGKLKETGVATTGLNRKTDALGKKYARQGTILTGVGKSVTSVSTRSGTLTNKLNLVGNAMTNLNKKGTVATKGLETGIKKVETNVGKLKTKSTAMSLSFTQGLGKVNNALKKTAAGTQRLLMGVSKGMMGMQKIFMMVGDFGRLLSQAMTNFGRSMMFFVSLPLIGALVKAGKIVIDFEDAMVRTGKTTDLWGEQLRELAMGLREMSLATSTSHVELATMAEQVGQLGIRGKENILALVDLFQMMAITTDLSSDVVAKSMGKIGNAFGYDLSTDQGVRNITALATTINRLENETAASAAEIVTSMLKWAQAAYQLRITSAEAAGLSASMIALGMSEEEAGTALKNASFYMVKNIDKLQEALRLQDKYNTVAKARNEIEKDAVGVFLDLAEASEESESRTEAMIVMMEIGRLRGGRALMAIANNVDLVRANLERANTEWQHGNSLMEEYERALSSTKNQLKILSNNLNDVALTLGDTFLPYINKIVQVLIPAFQELNKWFQSLSDKTKLMAMGITLLVIAMGPLMFFFGQIFHALTLVYWAFGGIFKLIPMMISGIASLVGVLATLGGWALLIPAAIIGAFVVLLKHFQNIGVDVAGFFTKLADKAIAWGENLARNWGDGFLAGAIKYIMQAVSTVANWIASFFQSHSPPKKGPLRGILDWGTSLMETYLEGFALADFGILKTIAGYIEKILTLGIDDDGLMVKALGKLANAKVLFSKLVDTFNKTGQIADKLLNKIISGTGDYAKHLKNLIVLSLRYKRVQEELARIENQREKVQARFSEQILRISRGGGDVRYKVSAIRAAKRERDDDLRALAEREERLEKEEELLKNQLDLQKAMVDALLDQEDIFTRIADLLEKMAESGGGAGAGGGGGFALPEPEDVDDVRDALDELARTFSTIKDRISEAKIMFGGFMDALRGEPMKGIEEVTGITELDPTAPSEGGDPVGWAEDMEGAGGIYSVYTLLYNIGEKVRDIIGWFTEAGTKIGELWTEVKNWFFGVDTQLDDFSESAEGAKEGLQGIADVEGMTPAGIAIATLGGAIEILTAAVVGFIEGWDGGAAFSSLAESLGLVDGALDGFTDEGVDAGFLGFIKELGEIAMAVILATAQSLSALGFAMTAIRDFTWTKPGGLDKAEEALGKAQEYWKWVFGGPKPVEAGEADGKAYADGVSKAIEDYTTPGAMEFFQQPFPEEPTPSGGGAGLGKGGADITIPDFVTGMGLEAGNQYSDEFVSGLGDLGKAVEGLIYRPTELSDLGIEAGRSWNEDFTTAILSGDYTFDEIMAGMFSGLPDLVETDDFVTVGLDMAEGLATGLDGGTTPVVNAISGLIKYLIDKARDELEANSPSGVFKAIGMDTVLGFEEGFLEQWETSTATVVSALNSWFASIKGIGRSGMFILGKEMGAGFVDGLRSMLIAIAGRAPAPIGEYLMQIANALQIGSPSKVAEEMGMYFGQGFVGGVEGVMNGADFAMSATNSMNSGGIVSPTYVVQIDQPIISDEADMDLLVEKIKSALAHDVYRGGKYAGHATF